MGHYEVQHGNQPMVPSVSLISVPVQGPRLELRKEQFDQSLLHVAVIKKKKQNAKKGYSIRTSLPGHRTNQDRNPTSARLNTASCGAVTCIIEIFRLPNCFLSLAKYSSYH